MTLSQKATRGIKQEGEREGGGGEAGGGGGDM